MSLVKHILQSVCLIHVVLTLQQIVDNFSPNSEVSAGDWDCRHLLASLHQHLSWVKINFYAHYFNWRCYYFN